MDNFLDRVVQRTNTLVWMDHIDFLVKPCKRRPAFFRDLYLNEGLSAAQIAERVRLSKTAVLERLRQQGIRDLPDRKATLKNYRLYEPPYGFSMQGEKLVPNLAEMKVCRWVVEFRERSGWSFKAIGLELEYRGFKNRRGQKAWSYGVVARIFRRWKGKL